LRSTGPRAGAAQAAATCAAQTIGCPPTQARFGLRDTLNVEVPATDSLVGSIDFTLVSPEKTRLRGRERSGVEP